MSDDVRLLWAGKRPPVPFARPPALLPADGSGESGGAGYPNALIHGDNLAAMAALRPDLGGKFALIYLDPPFFTGKQWRSRADSAPRAEGAGPGSPDPDAGGFSDDWAGGLSAYLQWLYDRLLAARDLLAADGCLYLHLGWHAVHYAKLIMDDVFGLDHFQNEIVWCYREAINSKKRWNRKHDSILFYSRSDAFTFNYDAVRDPYSEGTLKKFRSKDENGPYRLMGRGITDSPLRSKRDIPPHMETLFPELTYRHYLGEGTLPVDYWLIDIENQASKVRTGYPTQKPEALLERILLASSNEGDLIGDFCCGSGTTLAVAARLGRRWIGCDAGALAISTTHDRLTAQGAVFGEYRVAV